MHHDHPWIGRDVEDTASGRRGILRAIAPDVDQPHLVAWLRPPAAGLSGPPTRGRLANPAPLTPDTNPKGEQ